MAKSKKSSKRTSKRSKATKSRKSSRKKRTRQSPSWQLPDLSFMLHPIFWAGLMFLFALLTTGTLLSQQPGTLLAWWRQRVRQMVGGAIYLVPIVTFAIGWWLMRYAIAVEDPEQEEEPTPPTWRVAGVLMLLTAVAGALHLFAFSPDPQALANQGGGGGIVGFVFSDLMVRNVGLWLTIPLLLMLAFVGVMLALAITPAEVVHALRHARRLLRGEEQALAPEDVWEDVPTIEAPEAYWPWWKRLWNRLRERKAKPESVPTRIIGEEPEPNGPVTSPFVPVDETTEPVITTATPHPAPPREAGTTTTVSPAQTRPAPSITADVSGHTWRLPDIRAIFEDSDEGDISEEEIRQRSRIIEETLAAFGVPVRVVEVNRGPTVTQFGVQPGYIEKLDRKTGTIRREKVKVARILALQNDLALALAAAPIRIEAPVPGKPIVGIEVPNKRTAIVTLRSVLESDVWRTFKGRLKIALGRDVAGRPVVADLARMPHVLIAGATGSGKSVCINAIITCLMATHTPDEVRFILVDPKRVELTTYEGVPHLIGNVITEVDLVVSVLQWAVREMERRYELFAKSHVRDIVRYNKKAEQDESLQPLPYIVIVVDELADLMLSAPDEVEHAVVRLAQMARATGIHLVLATQRPSVDVVTGLIKANFPARIAFAVTSQVDSRVILDSPGAEQLLGQGDMLFLPPDSSKLARLQGVYVSDREIQRLVAFWKEQRPTTQAPAPDFADQGEAGEPPAPEHMAEAQPADEQPAEWEQAPLWRDLLGDLEEEKSKAARDPLFDEAVRVVREANRASISLLQRRLKIGYSRAGRLIDQLEEAGIVGPDPGGGRSRPVYPPAAPAKEEAPPAAAPPSAEDDATFANETRAAQPQINTSPPEEKTPPPPPEEEKKPAEGKKRRIPRIWY